MRRFLVLSIVLGIYNTSCSSLWVDDEVSKFWGGVTSNFSDYITKENIWNKLKEDSCLFTEPSELKNKEEAEQAVCHRLAALKNLISMIENDIRSNAFDEDNPIQAAIEAIEIRLFEACRIYCEKCGRKNIKTDSNQLYQLLKSGPRRSTNGESQ